MHPLLHRLQKLFICWREPTCIRSLLNFPLFLPLFCLCCLSPDFCFRLDEPQAQLNPILDLPQVSGFATGEKLTAKRKLQDPSWGQGHSLVAEHLPSMWEALDLIPHIHTRAHTHMHTTYRDPHGRFLADSLEIAIFL